MASQLQKLHELASELGVDPSWIQESADGGDIPCFRVPDGCGGETLLFHRDHAADAIASMAIHPSPKVQKEGNDE